MATKSSFYSNTGTTTNNIASITSLSNAATTAKNAAETAQAAAEAAQSAASSSASAAAASATTSEDAIQSAADVRSLVESASDSNVFTDADHTKLNGIEASATADQTNAEIRAAVEAATDSNVFTDADHTKLNGIAASANAYVHPNHSGEVTSTADGAQVIVDDVVDEANLKVSNSPTNGYVLSAQSGNTGGLTWIAAGGGETNQNAFSNVAVSGQDTVAADAATDTLNLTAGSNVTITTNASSDTVTITSTDTNTTYSVGDGGLTQNNFTNTLKTKLDGIASSANNYVHPNHSGDVVSTADGATVIQVDAVDIPMLSATGTASSTTFLRGDNAWVTPTDTNTTYSIGDGGLTQNNFTNTLKTKLDGIEASATADQTNAEIRAAVEAASDSNIFTDADHTKLNAVPASIDEAGTAVAMAIALG